ncbi:hypothetical protein [Acidovorax sp. sic0104]|uniref:hypothetical protein n=1 Tax=Acidovorax sp. sic0104 TaxID=2854784 RepID=UPI001C47CF88|nr:hypothetical protein [Acidovorax sp. sic0104]MBV7544667.1 hypothetical protein [Acidovorax sp. sic0104]
MSFNLTTEEQALVRRALLYWQEHWDFECPTLFGIELEDLEVVVYTWPHHNAAKEVEALAVTGALRELLYGASTPPKERLPLIIGVGYEGASALCTKVHRMYRSSENRQ